MSGDAMAGRDEALLEARRMVSDAADAVSMCALALDGAQQGANLTALRAINPECVVQGVAMELLDVAQALERAGDLMSQATG